MKSKVVKQINLILPKDALRVIFDECDRFDRDETGGRILGTFAEDEHSLTLQITGMVDAGPRATRSPVSFFQDGEYQEGIFREIERAHPETEHLGNWHTHHVNGLSHLSSGDHSTYHRIVNHRNHNTCFFYALLVVAKQQGGDDLARYTMKHYVFRRNDSKVYEIPASHVKISDDPLHWPVPRGTKLASQDNSPPTGIQPRPERVIDRDILAEFYPLIKPFASKNAGFYWRGPLDLLGDTTVEVIVVERPSDSEVTYSVMLDHIPSALSALAEQLADRQFPSARAALIATERCSNRVLFGAPRHANDE